MPRQIDPSIFQARNISRKRIEDAQSGSASEVRLLCEHLESVEPGLAYKAIWDWFPFSAKEGTESYGIAINILLRSCIRALGVGDARDHIREMIDSDEKINGDNYWIHEHRGHLLMGHDAASPWAYYHYAMAASKSRGMNVYHLTYGTETIRPYSLNALGDVFRSTIPGSTERVENAVSTSLTTPKAVHLVSCDSGYFKKYVENLAASYSSSDAQSVLCLCHVVNPDDDVRQSAIELSTKYPNIAFDFERVEMPAKRGKNWDKAYYASARFTRLVSALDRFNAPVIVTDVDVRVGDNFLSAIDLLEGQDFGLCSGVASMRSYYPWTRVSAGLLIISNSQRGREFAGMVSTYIESVMGWGPFDNNWGIDQTALWAAVMRLQEKYGSQEFARLRLKQLTSDQKGRY